MTLPISFSYPWYLLFLLALGPVIWLWRVGRNPFRRWREALSLALRVAILALVVLSIAGLQWVQASDELAVVFLLDVSDSIDAEARKQAVAFIRAALAEMGPDDRAALVLFGADALVERPLSQAKELAERPRSVEHLRPHLWEELLSIPATAHTDVGKAVRLGLALLPATAQRRLVLLSDGRANVPGGETAAQLAAASGVELDTVPLPARSGDEAWVDAVNVPHVLYEGETFSVVVRVQSIVSQQALIRLFANDRLAAEEAVLLHPGPNSFLFNLSADAPGFSTFTAQLVPRVDVFYQNNVLGAFALVHGAPRVLIVAQPEYEDESTPVRGRSAGLMVDDAEKLAVALERAGLYVEQMTPAYMSPDLASLGEYASIVLVNVPAPDLSPRQMEVLQAYVRDLGRGLVCVGGEESYGVGGYYKTPLEEMLPVEMTIKDKERMPPLAIVFVIDKSGSMDVAASQGGTRAPYRGTRKIDLAKEAILRSLELLTPGDQVGVVAFESTARWVWPLAGLTDVAAVQEQVATIRADGGTDIYAGLDAAVTVLEGSDAQLKHVILLTDGGASQEGLSALAARLQATKGTLSTVGVGQDAAPFLRQLAIDGGGRYHYTDDPSTIPQIFVQETSLAQRAYIVEETFYPALAGRSAILEGIEAVPVLRGYVASSIKPAAQMILASSLDDPVLAQWQYGLGRSVAWTSDAKGKWAQEWVRWEQFPRFWAQAVRWTIVERDESGLETQIVDEGERAHVVVDVVAERSRHGEAEGEFGPQVRSKMLDRAWTFRNNMITEVHLISPSMERETITLRQTAPGRYEGDFSPEEEGIYLVRVVAVPSDVADASAPRAEDHRRRSSPDGPMENLRLTQVTGFVRTYSPEYRTFGTDEVTLRRLAEAGGGKLLADPSAVFTHDQDVVRTYTDVWPWLLGVAICLLPLDVGVRRVTINWRDVGRAVAGVRARFRRRPRKARPSERISRLMAAKERAPIGAESRAQEAVEVPGVPLPVAEPSVMPVPPETSEKPVELPRQQTEPIPPVSPEPEPGEGERRLDPLAGEGTMTSRLLAAKRRARRGKAKERDR